MEPIGKKRKLAHNSPQPPLRVFIIEEHTECLECLALGVRRKLIQMSECELVHFDSHPDLSCPENIKPADLQNRLQLAHLLRNSEHGISTFIIPSIALGLIRDVNWIRPPWSDQIPVGEHNLTLGWVRCISHGANNQATQHNYDASSVDITQAALENNGYKHTVDVGCLDTLNVDRTNDDKQLVVKTRLGYWADDGVAVSDDTDLENAHNFVLTVTDGASNVVIPRTSKWILDICLDYFSCNNPLGEPGQPHHISTHSEIEQMLLDFETVLFSAVENPPSLIIIARSEMDGFTPETVAADLESKVLSVISTVYGEHRTLRIASPSDFYDPHFIRNV